MAQKSSGKEWRTVNRGLIVVMMKSLDTRNSRSIQFKQSELIQHWNLVTRQTYQISYITGRAGDASWSIEGETVVSGDSVDGTGTLVFQLDAYHADDYTEKVEEYPMELNINDPIHIEVC